MMPRVVALYCTLTASRAGRRPAVHAQHTQLWCSRIDLGSRPLVDMVAIWICWLMLVHLATGQAAPTEQQQLEARVKQLHELLKSNPLLVNEHAELAMALQQLNHLSPDGGRRVPEAEKAYRHVLALAQPGPATVQVRGNLGALLLSAGRSEDALTELNAAIIEGRAAGLLLHELAGLVFNKAKALSMLGRVEEADKTYASAANAAHGHDFGTYGKALAAIYKPIDKLMKQAGEVAYHGRRLMQDRPGLSFLADLQNRWPGSIPKRRKAKQLEWVQSGSNVDLSWLHFALFKYHDMQRDFDVAWLCLEAANHLMAATTNYDPAAEHATLQHIKALFQGPFDGTTGVDDPTPIFVIGMPRSGSTLVEQMLGSHPEVFAAGEDTALAPITGDLNAALAQPGANHRDVLAGFGRRYVTDMRKRISVPAAALKGNNSSERGSGTGSSDSSGGDGASSNSKTIKGNVASGSSSTPKVGNQPSHPRRIVDKMLHNVWLVGYIQLLLPSACMVHVARHPLDTALSCYSQPFGYSGMAWSWDLHHIASQISMTWELMEHWDRLLPGRILTVHYEDLVANPADAAREVLQHCGLEWDDSVLNFHTSEGRTIATASMTQVRQPLYNSSVARWRRYDAQLMAVHEELRPLVQKYEARLQSILHSREKHQQQPLLHGRDGSESTSMDGEEGPMALQEPTSTAASRDEL